MFDYNSRTLLITKSSLTGERPPFVSEKMEIITTSSPYPHDASFFGVWSDASGKTYEEIYILKQKELLSNLAKKTLEMRDSFYLNEMKRVCFAADNGNNVSEEEEQIYLAFRRFDIAVSSVVIKGEKENSITFLTKNETASEEERKRIIRLALELNYEDEMFYLKDTYEDCRNEYEAIYQHIARLFSKGNEKINLVLYLPFNKKVIGPLEVSLAQLSIDLFATINAEEKYLIISK